MKPLPFLLVALAGAVVCASCASPASHVAPARQSPAWQDTGTPPPSVAYQREVRYYKDETGAIWDDRGRKLGVQP